MIGGDDTRRPTMPPPVGRGAALRRWLASTYLTIDARSLGAGRVGLALVLLFDLAHRAADLTVFYTNVGLIPNHTVLWRPPTQWMFSFFFLLSWPDEVAFGFALCGVVYLLLLVGWRTRLMQALALACVLSLHGRVTMVENGGDWMLGELALWTAFLPLGRRFSLDAVRASLRARTETTAAELAALAPPRDGPQIVSLAAFALVLQLAVSYFFNAIQKGGPTWRSGSAVHYVLHQDRMVTWFGVWMRPHMSLALSRVLSWSALGVEGALPALLLWPARRAWTRRAAVAAIVGLHLGFQCFINLGVFSWTMIAYAPFLLTAADWRWLAARAARGGRPIVAWFDAGCGVCFQLARVCARLDRFGHVKLVSSTDPDAAGIAPARLAADALVVVEPAADGTPARVFTRADAVARVIRALPLGGLWSLPLRAPGLRAVANRAYAAVARRRRPISIWLGLTACGVPSAPPAMAPAPAPAAPVARQARALASWLREAATLAMLIALVTEALYINQVVPPWLRPSEPTWIKRLIAYPRLIQAWSMFASDAPNADESVVVDAVTADGRHVDPYSEVAGRYPNPGARQIPPRLDNDSLFFNYSYRIPSEAAYHQAFLEWILHYPVRTGRAADRIVRFDAYEVEDDSPPPGETRPRNARSRIFLSYPPR